MTDSSKANQRLITEISALKKRIQELEQTSFDESISTRNERQWAEYDLSKAKNHYHTLFDAIDEGFCIIEVIFDENEKPIDYRFLEANPAFEKQTGLIGVQGKRRRELAVKHEQQWFDIYGKIAITGQSSRLEKHSEPLHRWYDIYAFRVGEPENRQVAVLFNDITARKQAENDLRESEKKYHSLFENSIVGISLALPDGRLVAANTAYAKMYGYASPEEMMSKVSHVGQQLYANPEERKEVLHILTENGFMEPREFDVVRSNGEHFPVIVGAREIRDINETLLYYQAEHIDITKLKLLESELQESKAKVLKYINYAPYGVFMVDDTGRYIEANKAACRITGYSKKEIENMSIQDLLAEKSLEEGLVHFKKLMDTGVAISDLWHKNKDGSERCLTVSGVKLSEKRALGFYKDITEQRKAEKSLRETVKSLRKAISTTIQVIISTVEARDPYTAAHQLRSADLARAIATEMEFSPDRVEGIWIAGSIHDLGKLSVPAEILSKPTRLSDNEFSLIKEHARKGYDILKNVESSWPLAEIVYQHHERMDGSGYPRNLKGDEILMEARIMAVADVVEAMASHRPYRASLGIDAALKEIEDNRGILYDANVVDICLRLFREKGFTLEKT